MRLRIIHHNNMRDTTMDHATPDELRARGKEHLANWRRLLPIDADAAAEELATASNLAMLAAEADEAKANAALARMGE